MRRWLRAWPSGRRSVWPALLAVACAALLLGIVVWRAGAFPWQGPGPGLRNGPGATARQLPAESAASTLSEREQLALAESFDPEQALRTVGALSAPEYAGRQTGAPGAVAAAEFIAEQFRALGLEPAGTQGYLQAFDAPYAEVTSLPSLVVTDGSGRVHRSFALGRDFRYLWGGRAGGGDVEAPVVWVGDGEGDDYELVDVKGQVAFCRTPNFAPALRQAVEHGARGLLIMADSDRRIVARRSYRELLDRQSAIPAFWITTSVASALLNDGANALDALQALDGARPLTARAHLRMTLQEPPSSTGRNVLALWPGADPVAKHQLLVLGAHYDHLGLDANGELYPGANDDASGVATLIEIARSWRAAGYSPSCSVLFAAWDGEEQGLFGSTYYVQHARLPLPSTFGMIQLDMVGVASQGVMTIEGSDNETGAQLLQSARLLGIDATGVRGGSGSDHQPFLMSGVASSLLIWDGAHVPYYHTPSDVPETLQPERLRQAGALASHASLVLIAEMAHKARETSWEVVGLPTLCVGIDPVPTWLLGRG